MKYVRCFIIFFRKIFYTSTKNIFDENNKKQIYYKLCLNFFLIIKKK